MTVDDQVQRLFCFPYAGDFGSAYSKWPGRFPPSIQVRPIVFPGRGSRIDQPLLRRIEPLVKSVSDELEDHLGSRFAFFGHSLGALVAYEVACELAVRHSRYPTTLFVSGRRAPDLPSTDRDIHALPDAEFVETIRRFDGTPAATLGDSSLMEYVMPVLRADLEVNETYSHRARVMLPSRVVVFGGDADPFVRHDELIAWTRLTTGSSAVHLLHGGHFFIHANSATIIDLVLRELQRT